MCDPAKPEEVIEATQKAIFYNMMGLIEDLKKKIGGPGLTWEQLDFLIINLRDKKPIVVHQKGEM